ncbi:hypothetical protein FACS189499_07950 [Clostridia bacterium]|nr:hypothetical protein FACS189499_07950 [Clostridia bacterium]
MNGLISNIDKLHTTQLGVERIRRNLGLDTTDIVAWCEQSIMSAHCSITRKGKNWYASVNDCQITVNAHSYTIITAHNTKR